MKILSLLFLFSHGNFIDKKQSSQFLSQRSKCGDACAKDKGKVSFMSNIIYYINIIYMDLNKFKLLHNIYQLLCQLINYAYYKHIFVRSKKVCLLWEKCLFEDKVLIMGSVLFFRNPRLPQISTLDPEYHERIFDI